MSILLEIKNLRALSARQAGKSGEKELLKGVDLKLRKGEIQAILGPNGSGKTVLSQVLMGNPKYRIIKGKIVFDGKNITKLSPEKRAGMGLNLSWQNPPAIKGVRLNQLLAKIAKHKYFQMKEAENLLSREVNVDFSGGEKKVSELLQILSLNPKLVIFDEIDSGLDMKKLQVVSKIIKKELLNKKISILLITHSGEILNFFKPDITNVMVDGKIHCKSKDYIKILKSIKKYGFEKCKKCKLFADK